MTRIARLALVDRLARLGLADRLAIVSGAVALAIRVPTLDLPLIEWHGWRQTWTAYTALIYHERGFDLLHPQLPIFGPPFEVPQEFPLVQALGALVMDVGVAPDLAMRVTHLALFFLSAGLLYGLLRYAANATVALAALVFFLFVPTSILWSRASLVEYGATAGAVGFLWAGIVWRDTRRWSLFAVALAAGTIGMLIKPTTPVFWSLPLALWRSPDETAGLVRWIRTRLDPGLIVLGIAPTTVAFAWTKWADAIKTASEAAAFMASSATSNFYYASLADRLDAAIWSRNWLWLTSYDIGLWVMPFFAVGLFAALRSHRRAFWAGVLLAAALPVAVFFGGFYRHEYYWSALTPEFACIVGLGVAWLVARARTLPLRGALAVALVVAFVATENGAADYWRLAHPPLTDYEHVLAHARELAQQTRPDEVALVIGRAYNPDLAYYSRRRVLMLPDENRSDHLLAAISRESYHILFSWDPTIDPTSIARRWAWTGVVGQWTYTLGQKPADLRGAPIMATDEAAAFDAAVRAGRPLLSRPLAVPCALGSQPFPAGASGTWLQIRADPFTRISPTAIFAPVPARTFLYLSPLVTLGQAQGQIFCSGGGAIVIEAAFDAPPPG
jgi:4-amino-4-deoxy-L-arabinose transferase-like glycosyltransferase